MHNFYHEIPLPEDKAIRKFLWVSFFHDALIQQILPGQPKPYDLTLQIYSGHDGSTYLLRFHGLEHFSGIRALTLPVPSSKTPRCAVIPQRRVSAGH